MTQTTRTPAEIDALVRKRTAFTSLADMLDTHPDYRPTLRQDAGFKGEMAAIADAYDAAQAERGDARRAYRG